MHGRSKMGTALTSNMATRERCRYRALVPRLSFFYFILFYLFFTESCRLNSVSTELERIGWWLKLTEMAETNRNGRNRPWFMHCTSKKLKPKPYCWVETHDWIQREPYSSTPQEPTTTPTTLLARDKVSCNIKRL